MRILLTAVQFSSSISGLQRHALNLVRALLRQREISTVHLVIGSWQRDLVQQADFDFGDRLILHVANVQPGALSRNLWHLHRLPQLAAAVMPDILHLSYPVPVRASALHCPVALTLHDLYPYEIPGNFGFPKVLFNRGILQHCLRNADAIACVSDSTLSSLREYGPRSAWSRAERIYNCVEPMEQAKLEPSLYSWSGHPFLLAVAQHRRNKNIPLLIRVFHRLLGDQRIHPQMKLLIVGMPGPETARLHRLVSELRLTERVLFASGLSDPGVQWCYRNAEALMAPSETEGFGLPVVEARLAGCRVVCSDIPAFREIAPTQCSLVPLGFGAEARFADATVATLRNSKPLPVDLPQFSAEAVGAQHVNLYRRLLPAKAFATNARNAPAPASALLTAAVHSVTTPRRDDRC